MKARFAGLLFSTCAALLAGCNKDPEVEVAKGDPCESLEPLLAALPTDKRMYGVPMTWRGCSVKHLSALAIYAAPGGHPSYEFTISVIDEKSNGPRKCDAFQTVMPTAAATADVAPHWPKRSAAQMPVAGPMRFIW